MIALIARRDGFDSHTDLESGHEFADSLRVFDRSESFDACVPKN